MKRNNGFNEFKHGGNVWEVSRATKTPIAELIDFSASINPLGFVDGLRPAMSKAIETLIHYPDATCSQLLEAVAGRHNVKPTNVIIGNGATEFIHFLPDIIRPIRTYVFVPSYSDYERTSLLKRIPIKFFEAKEEDSFIPDLALASNELRSGDMCFIGNPNNPTGVLLKAKEIMQLVRMRQDVVFVVDESFMDFVEESQSVIGYIASNLIVIKSMTKFYALPGLRLGAMFADKSIIQKARVLLPMWSVNTMAQVSGLVSLKDKAYEEKTRSFLGAERRRVLDELSKIKQLKVYSSAANFLLLRIESGLTATELAQKLLEKRILIRDCSNFRGLNEKYFRIAIKDTEANDVLIKALFDIFCKKSVKPMATKRAIKTLMIQGVSSNAGKSVMVAALCRIFARWGLKVAPFKAQNMALNSFVTRAGEEIGRAQAMQAFAAKVEPDARMNPILLKPSSDRGSQVIVKGYPIGMMKVKEYIKYKPKAFEIIKECFDDLTKEYDYIILEGAGSPAEVNLKAHDIVNMRMAEYARAPVLLVGDIDRGGVFASFIGTLETMAEWERRLVAGFIVNKFRGDASLLKDAFRYVEDFCGKSVFGVIPFIHDLELPEEDSVSLKEYGFLKLENADSKESKVKVVVIDLPHISNFTDFDPFKGEPDVELVLARRVADLANADAIILPGSKNTVADLKYLERIGIADRILQVAFKGKCVVVGICGGLQMLGKEICDAANIEASRKCIKALQLLPISTFMQKEKILTQVSAIHLPSGLKVGGYEIHHGKSDFKMCEPLFVKDNGEIIGGKSQNGKIWGTYLHGVFDDDRFRRYFIDELRKNTGLQPLGKVCYHFNSDRAFDRLADIFERNIDMKRLKGLLCL